jgi:hypothetical protein
MTTDVLKQSVNAYHLSAIVHMARGGGWPAAASIGLSFRAIGGG